MVEKRDGPLRAVHILEKKKKKKKTFHQAQTTLILIVLSVKKVELSRLLTILRELVKMQSEQAKALIPLLNTTQQFGLIMAQDL